MAVSRGEISSRGFGDALDDLQAFLALPGPYGYPRLLARDPERVVRRMEARLREQMEESRR